MGKSNKSRSRKQKNHHQYHATPSTSYSTEANSNESDIPGYYYDEEKKTYFKILPNSMSSAGSFVTSETIKKKKEEKRRVSDLKGGPGEDQSSNSASHLQRLNKPKQKTFIEPLMNVLHSMQCGRYTCRTLQHHMMRQRCLRLNPQPGWEKGIPEISERGIPFEDLRKMEVTSDYSKAAVVRSVSGFMYQYIKLMTLNAKTKQSSADQGRHLNLTIEDAGFQGTSADKVTSLCWSSLPRVSGKACLLYTSVCPVGYSRSRACVFNLEAAAAEEPHLFSYDLGKNTVWSSAWNHHRHRFSVGCERKCHIVDVETRSKWTYPTQNSDCLAQLFSPTNPHVLYGGTRNGFTLIMDLRTACQNPAVAKLNHRNPVVCLRSLQDENYLMASDFSGLIRMWDLRAQKSMTKYSGLVNSHYQIPFYLDDSEKFIYATGIDCYCHIWNVSDGSLLKRIPPPLAVQQDSNAISHLSHKWGGMDGNFGLVMGMADKFFLYS